MRYIAVRVGFGIGAGLLLADLLETLCAPAPPEPPAETPSSRAAEVDVPPGEFVLVGASWSAPGPVLQGPPGPPPEVSGTSAAPTGEAATDPEKVKRAEEARDRWQNLEIAYRVR